MRKTIEMTRKLTMPFVELQRSMRSTYVHIIVPSSLLEEKPVKKYGGTWYVPYLRHGFVHDRNWCHLGSFARTCGPKRFALLDDMLRMGLRFCVRVDRRYGDGDTIFEFSNLKKEEEELLPEFFTKKVVLHD